MCISKNASWTSAYGNDRKGVGEISLIPLEIKIPGRVFLLFEGASIQSDYIWPSEKIYHYIQELRGFYEKNELFIARKLA